VRQGAAWGVNEVAPNADLEAGASITVAVLDTGIDAKHSCFQGVALTVRNFSNSPHAHDIQGHGTHCAGIIFGRDVDGIRIGVARGVRRALIGKVLDDTGHGDSATIAQAMQWAQDSGAQVISMSIGIDFTRLVTWFEEEGKARAEAVSRALSAYRDTVRVFDTLARALEAQAILARRGAIAIAAAGNESARSASKPYVVDVSLPAAAAGIISTGAIALGPSGYEIAPFSNTNPEVCAPGVNIVSAKAGGGLCANSGTSMAAPHVAGIAALWCERAFAENPKSRAELVRSKLLASCISNGFAPGITAVDRGAGLVQAPR